jgi:hypothetical protein
MQEDPEITDFKNAAADTAHDVKKSVKPDDSTASKDSNEKSVLESVSPLVQTAFGFSLWYSCLVACNTLCILSQLKKGAKLEYVDQQTH